MNNNPEFSPEEQEAADAISQGVSELFKALNESGDDADRLFTCAMVGNNQHPYGMQTVHIIRGKPDGDVWPNGTRAENGIADFYDGVRKVLLEYDRVDIGPVEEAWFVLPDDCKAIDPPYVPTNPEEAWAGDIGDEWNILMNKPDDPFSAQVWARRKISYADLRARVQSMVVRPPNPNATYHWYDRTD